LEREDKTIGVVTGALGLRWYDCVWSGQDAHAGPTPMEARHDALRGASRMVEAVHELALRFAPHGRGTVGFMQVKPNSRNVIPGYVQLSVDFRHPTEEGLVRMDTALRNTCATIAQQSAVAIDVRLLVAFAPCVFDSGCVAIVR